jgi:hypothetical protein
MLFSLTIVYNPHSITDAFPVIGNYWQRTQGCAGFQSLRRRAVLMEFISEAFHYSGAATSSKLLVSCPCNTFVGQSTSPTPIPPDPPCVLPLLRTREEGVQGGLIRTRWSAGERFINCQWHSGALVSMAQVVRAYSVTLVEYPSVHSCFIGRWSRQVRGLSQKGRARFIVRPRPNAGSPSRSTLTLGGKLSAESVPSIHPGRSSRKFTSGSARAEPVGGREPPGGA